MDKQKKLKLEMALVESQALEMMDISAMSSNEVRRRILSNLIEIKYLLKRADCGLWTQTENNKDYANRE